MKALEGKETYRLTSKTRYVVSVAADGRLPSICSVVVAQGLRCSVYVGSSQIRDQTHVSCIGRQILYH